MNEKISDELKEAFGFEGVLGGPEYDAFPAWKKVIADALLAKGMEYRVIKSNFEASCNKSAQYIKEAKKLISGESESVPLYAKFSDVEEWVFIFEISKESIRTLIKIYNSEME
jgi:hypothetical protein